MVRYLQLPERKPPRINNGIRRRSSSSIHRLLRIRHIRHGLELPARPQDVSSSKRNEDFVYGRGACRHRSGRREGPFRPWIEDEDHRERPTGTHVLRPLEDFLGYVRISHRTTRLLTDFVSLDGRRKPDSPRNDHRVEVTSWDSNG